MARRNRFTVSAESVQGEEGATATFRCIRVGEWRQYLKENTRDNDVLKRHLVDWAGFLDDDGNPLPSPKDEPGIIDALYLHEQNVLTKMLWDGPDGAEAKNAASS